MNNGERNIKAPDAIREKRNNFVISRIRTVRTVSNNWNVIKAEESMIERTIPKIGYRIGQERYLINIRGWTEKLRVERLQR